MIPFGRKGRVNVIPRTVEKNQHTKQRRHEKCVLKLKRLGIYKKPQQVQAKKERTERQLALNASPQ